MGRLPTWIGWYVQHLPHWFHAATVDATLGLELGAGWMLFLPRRWRIVCFFIVTPWQIGVILTANYTFLNYLVLALGVLLLDDRFVLSILPERWKNAMRHSDSTRTQTPVDRRPRARGSRLRTPWNALELASPVRCSCLDLLCDDGGVHLDVRPRLLCPFLPSLRSSPFASPIDTDSSR